MELRQLTGFVAVAEESNFCRAANRLYLSQPALSRLVKKLELELGVALFDRSTHHVELTPAGRSFLAHARAVLANAEEAARSARRAAHEHGGRLRVGYEDSTEDVVAAALRSFRRQAPDVALSVAPVEEATRAEVLRQDDVDVVVGRAGLDGEHFDSEVVFDEPAVVALAPDHPLTAADRIDISSLAAGHTVFVPRASGHLRPRIAGLWEEARLPAPELEEVASVGAGAMMAGAGLGVVIVPESTASSSAPGGVAYRRFHRPGLSVPLVVSRLRTKASPAVAGFVEAVRTSQETETPRRTA